MRDEAAEEIFFGFEDLCKASLLTLHRLCALEKKGELNTAQYFVLLDRYQDSLSKEIELSRLIVNNFEPNEWYKFCNGRIDIRNEDTTNIFSDYTLFNRMKHLLFGIEKYITNFEQPTEQENKYFDPVEEYKRRQLQRKKNIIKNYLEEKLVVELFEFLKKRSFETESQDSKDELISLRYLVAALYPIKKLNLFVFDNKGFTLRDDIPDNSPHSKSSIYEEVKREWAIDNARSIFNAIKKSPKTNLKLRNSSMKLLLLKEQLKVILGFIDKDTVTLLNDEFFTELERTRNETPNDSVIDTTIRECFDQSEKKK